MTPSDRSAREFPLPEFPCGSNQGLVFNYFPGKSRLSVFFFKKFFYLCGGFRVNVSLGTES